ncbi:MAG: DUF3106 domain-containing protein [Acidobacteriota bacterium]
MAVWLPVLALVVAGGAVVCPSLAQSRRAVAPPRPPAAKVFGPRAGRVLDRLNRMTPEERRRTLQNLPPDRRQRVEEQLERYNRLPAQEQQRLRLQLDRFRDWPPEQQEAVRRLFRRFNAFPEDRRALLKEEFRALNDLEPADRRARINSDEFRSRYTLAEQQFLQDYASLLLPQE